MENVEWDEEKNKLNQLLHGMDFEDAKYVFADPGRLDLSEGNIYGEERLTGILTPRMPSQT